MLATRLVSRFGHWLLMITLGLNLIGCAQIINVTTSEPIQLSPYKRSLGTKIDDSQLATVATVNLKKASNALAEAHINVDSFNGYMLLTGQVPSVEERELATATASKIHGVRELHNHLSVAPPSDLKTRSYDTWLSTKLNTKMLLNSQIKTGSIRIITEAKTVYLMGLVSRYQADRITQIASTTRGVKAVVKVFEYVD
jgi:osmotically-inducible protein OsmY